jgi:predicted NUDIX family phosphoesterase
MPKHTNSLAPTPHATADEKILVVHRTHLFAITPIFIGFQPLHDFSSLQTLVQLHQEFHWRSTMEDDPSYKQIIPYLVFEHNNSYFLMRRRSTASEQRLKNKYSLGIGGHIRQEDLTSCNLIDWAQREFYEEVSYRGSLTTAPLGLINDESNAVGQVHFGCVFLLRGDSPNIAIRAEHKEGRLVSLEDCKTMYDDLESWSQIVYNHLKGSL